MLTAAESTGAMMALIDRYIPDPHYKEHHRVSVQASAGIVIAAAAAYRTDSDPFFRRILALRELPMRAGQFLKRQHSKPLSPFGIDNFTLLERSEGEVVLGLVGRFWRPDFGLVPISSGRGFFDMKEAGVAKLVLNFAVRPGRAGVTILSTETRVFCVDRASSVRFAPYWYLIRPASGLIRRRTLTVIRRTCEDNPDHVAA